MADTNVSAERQRAVRGGHSRAIQALTIGSAMTTKPVPPAVNARHFGVRETTNNKQDCRRNKRNYLFHLSPQFPIREL